MRDVLLVFGTRPEAIKMAPVVQALRAHPQLFRCRVCVTAQHREMLDQVLRVFDIVPDHDLAVMTTDQDLTDVSCRVLERLRAQLAACPPACVLVHGDTTTTFAAALAAFYQHIPVGHVEAGLRTGLPDCPFPEEMNRRLTGALACWHFAPTPRACANLLREGVLRESIVVTGNTAIDAVKLRLAVGLSRGSGAPRFSDGRRGILVTAHRRELFGDGVRRVCEALREIANRRPEVHIIYAVHQNPRVRGPAHEILDGVERVTLVPPLEYDEFLSLMVGAALILTDSGGIQEEAPSLGKPVLVMRDTTERPEAVTAGTVAVVGTRRESIVNETLRLLDDRAAYDRMARATNPYGDGFAAPRIVANLAERLGLSHLPLRVAREFSPSAADDPADGGI